MKQKVSVFVILFFITLTAAAQEYNSVPLHHSVYNIIELGVIRGLVSSPPSAKPWPEIIVKEKLLEMLESDSGKLSKKEEAIILNILNSFTRKNGFDAREARFYTELNSGTIEAGLELEGNFSVNLLDVSSFGTSKARLFTGGDITDIASWNFAVTGAYLFMERTVIGEPDRTAYAVSAVFPHSKNRQWDGLVSLLNPGEFSAWPEDPSFAYSLEAEINAFFFDRMLQLRLGRIRRDWGPGSNGTSLFINSGSRPFLALEGIVSPLPWMNISLINGALEYYREESEWPSANLFTNMFSAIQAEFNPWKFVHFEIGGSAIWLHQINAAFFTTLQFNLPGNIKLWGSLFVDNLNPGLEDFPLLTGNSYVYQIGLKAAFHWLPFSSFSIRYTKTEPYCYTDSYDHYEGTLIPSLSAYVNSGESMGFYMPPNSDEFFLRLDSMFFYGLKVHFQYQMTRQGADFGYGAVNGSSLKDKLDDPYAGKYFLMDGVYRWENIFKLGASLKIKVNSVPLVFFAETGFVNTTYTINAAAWSHNRIGTGYEAEYQSLNDSVYKTGNRFIFSAGFKIFTRND